MVAISSCRDVAKPELGAMTASVQEEHGVIVKGVMAGVR